MTEERLLKEFAAVLGDVEFLIASGQAEDFDGAVKVMSDRIGAVWSGGVGRGGGLLNQVESSTLSRNDGEWNVSWWEIPMPGCDSND